MRKFSVGLPLLAALVGASGEAAAAVDGIFADSGEGTLTAWSATINAISVGTPKSNPAVARYSGQYGILAQGTGAYAQDNSPGAEKKYFVQFYVFTGLSGGTATVFRALNSTPSTMIEVDYDATANKFVFATSGASGEIGGIARNKWYAVSLGWDAITSQAMSVAVRGAGGAATTTTIGGVSGTNQIDTAQLGWIAGVGTSSPGIIVDAFASKRATAPVLLVRGDANGDGQLTGADISAIQSERAGTLAIGQPDCDENGLVQLADEVCVAEASGTPFPTGTTLESDLNPANPGQLVTLTATVSGVSPTGTVEFASGLDAIAGCAAQPMAGSDDTATATCATSALPSGDLSITASYSGDAHNGASQSSILHQLIGAPSITAPASASTLEDSASAPIDFTVGDPNTPAGSLVVTAHSSDQSVVTDASLAAGLGGSGSERTLVVAPVPDANSNSLSIFLSVTNAANVTVGTTVPFAVIPVNDVPSATFGPDLAVPASTPGPVSVLEGFATGIQPGPGESQQVVDFPIVEVLDPADVIGGIQIDGSDSATPGALRYTLTGSPGLATFEVKAHDDGGLENGGVDESGPHRLTVLVGSGAALVVSIVRTPPRAASSSGAEAPTSQAGYSIVVTNKGNAPLQGVALTVAARGLLNVVWDCQASVGECAPALGGTPIGTAFDLAPGNDAVLQLVGDVDVEEPFIDIAAQATGSSPSMLRTGSERAELSEPTGSDGVYKNGFD